MVHAVLGPSGQTDGGGNRDSQSAGAPRTTCRHNLASNSNAPAGQRRGRDDGSRRTTNRLRFWEAAWTLRPNAERWISPEANALGVFSHCSLLARRADDPACAGAVRQKNPRPMLVTG